MAGDSHAPSLLFLICGDRVFEAFKTALTLGDQAPCITKQGFGVF